MTLPARPRYAWFIRYCPTCRQPCVPDSVTNKCLFCDGATQPLRTEQSAKRTSGARAKVDE